MINEPGALAFEAVEAGRQLTLAVFFGVFACVR
jgi:hypothetical protein